MMDHEYIYGLSAMNTTKDRVAELRPRRIETDDYYRVVLDPSKAPSCTECGAGRFWTIAGGTGANEFTIEISWADQTLAETIRDLMNMARSEALPVEV